MNCGVEWGGPRRKGERAATWSNFLLCCTRVPVRYHNLCSHCSHARRERLEGGREERTGGRDGGRWFVG